MSLISGLAALAAASTLSTQAVPPQDRPETLERLMACRGIADNTARLACFDTAAGAPDTAQRQGDLVVIDRAGVAETRRQLFGFEMPSLPRLFGPEGAVEIGYGVAESRRGRGVAASVRLLATSRRAVSITYRISAASSAVLNL